MLSGPEISRKITIFFSYMQARADFSSFFLPFSAFFRPLFLRIIRIFWNSLSLLLPLLLSARRHVVHLTSSPCSSYTVTLYSVHRRFVLRTSSLCAFLLSGAFRILQKIHFLNFSVPRNLHNSKIFCIFAPIFESLKGRNSTFVMGSFFLS